MDFVLQLVAGNLLTRQRSRGRAWQHRLRIIHVRDTATAHQVYGIALTWMGRFEEALREFKRALDPASTVPRADIMKHIVDKCPNVSFILDSRKSDFMLEAWGWSGNYKFTVFQKGGQAVYSTSTVLLSNAVKDVCKFVNSQNGRDTW
jgi:hypothetical protein